MISRKLISAAAFALALALGTLCINAPARAESAEAIARLAMSTASLWMVEHHEHEIAEALEKGDLRHAAHEAEELIPWLKGTAWSPGTMKSAHALAAAASDVARHLKAENVKAGKEAFTAMRMKVHTLHHELMEEVAGGHGGGHKH